MKIIFLTDIHGAFERVRSLLLDSVADIYIVAGDLIDIPFYNMETAIRYHDLQTFFNSLKKQSGKTDTVIEDFVDELLERPDISDELQEKGSKYQEFTIRARRVMQQKYKVLENMLTAKSGSRSFCLPGNYDMDLKYTSLHERDLHLHWNTLNGIKIAGYGGSSAFTTGIPQRYVVKYGAGIGISDNKNEMYSFFKAVKPDVIVVHHPANGVHDWLPSYGPIGSPALRTYCDNNAVLLCLSGHIHNKWGFKNLENTIYLNPSNFGEVTTISGDVSEGGFFYQIEIDNGAVKLVTFKKHINDRIYDIAEHAYIDGAWTEKIIDAKRYDALQRSENFDSLLKKYHHIPEIVLYNEIKQFFRTFQTQETDERVDRLEKVIQKMEGKFEDIALDIVGSVNVGLSEPGSDIDFVLYHRCDAKCTTMHSDCGHCQKVKEMLDDLLGKDYKFDIIDCIDLSVVEESIRTKNYECEVTQRFVAYRAICRTINYRVIAPLEQMLNEDPEFRKELEGSIRSYFKIFAANTTHLRSFEKYEARLKSIGIKLPDSVRKKISAYLQKETGGEENS